PYFTLSHCWGTSQRTCLMSNAFRAFADFTSFSGLPKTYQHAFLVTFSLGYRFIWIDSLCIVQDDEEDWKAQASMMSSVYKGACCNIAATWAPNGDWGCFIPTRASPLITLDLGLGQAIAYKVSLAASNQYYDDLVEAPLNQRAWVVQERYLARKQLSFTRSGAYWECHELVASEQFPTGVPKESRDFRPYSHAGPPTGKPTVNLDDPITLQAAWVALVDFYSGCQLTKLSDKTVALAGLAEEVRRAMEDEYLAGLWKKDLVKQLCWATDFDVRRRAKRLRIPTFVAPTWSWMSVDGPV
ncbi:HET-domain-containing protein, partial [Eremomyces bilateralis CBS 781.70]